MGIENLRRWHWIAIGLALGLAAGYVHRSLQAPPASPVGMGQREFESMLQVKPEDPATPAIDEITVVPVGNVYWVSALRRYVSLDGTRYEYRPEWLALERKEYRPILEFAGKNDANYSVREYLRDMAAKHPHIRYKYAWQREPGMILAMWTAGGLLVIGGVWPTILKLLIGAGFGRQVDEPHLDLSRFGSEAEPNNKTATLTPEDDEKLKSLEAEMERNLAPTASAGAQTETKQPASVAELRGEVVATQPGEAKEEKEFAGEFYPTEAHAPRP